jgi:hypothetical protein
MKMTILKTMAATFCKTDREHKNAQQQRQENRKNSKTKEEKKCNEGGRDLLAAPQ